MPIRAQRHERIVINRMVNSMTKDELIAKQQIEIEELKLKIYEYKEACNDVRNALWRPEQWSPKCPDFPRVAMVGIVHARQAIDGL